MKYKVKTVKQVAAEVLLELGIKIDGDSATVKPMSMEDFIKNYKPEDNRLEEK